MPLVFRSLASLAVARAGGIDHLARRVHPLFAGLFPLLIYLSIGPCLAIPRTASTSFEMTVMPFLGEGVSIGMAQIIYSSLFFAAAFVVALKPEKLTDRLGQDHDALSFGSDLFYLCKLFVSTDWQLCRAGGGRIASIRRVQGFLDGYQTMDTIAAIELWYCHCLEYSGERI